MSERIRVATRPRANDYDVVIEHGRLDRLASLLPAAHRYVVIADETVADLYADPIAAAIGAEILTFPPGEKHKTVQTWTRLAKQLTELGVGRDCCIVALGGGVTGDLAGFVAATYMRGVPYVQVPTTLLAMIDASIGGKTGIDTDHGKNLIGAFHQPYIVVIDPEVLRTLPEHELRCGLAEAVKHGAIADAEYARQLAAAVMKIVVHDMRTLIPLIRTSVAIKARFVSNDVQETGARAALNFGHTIAHALEHASRYAIPHGEAVAIGMMVEAAAGEAAGITAQGTSAQLKRVLEALGLSVAVPPFDPDAILAATRTDKKSRGDQQRYTLLQRFGAVARDESGGWTRTLPDDVVRETLARLSITRGSG
jgi:3-dehydroquinate synthase